MFSSDLERMVGIRQSSFFPFFFESIGPILCNNNINKYCEIISFIRSNSSMQKGDIQKFPIVISCAAIRIENVQSRNQWTVSVPSNDLLPAEVEKSSGNSGNI